MAVPHVLYYDRAGGVKVVMRSDASAILWMTKHVGPKSSGVTLETLLAWVFVRAHAGACQVDHVSCPNFEICLRIFIS